MAFCTSDPGRQTPEAERSEQRKPGEVEDSSGCPANRWFVCPTATIQTHKLNPNNLLYYHVLAG